MYEPLVLEVGGIGWLGDKLAELYAEGWRLISATDDHLYLEREKPSAVVGLKRFGRDATYHVRLDEVAAIESTPNAGTYAFRLKGSGFIPIDEESYNRLAALLKGQP